MVFDAESPIGNRTGRTQQLTVAVSRVTVPEDVLPNGSEYQTCRRYMTGDANAAIGGAYDAGA